MDNRIQLGPRKKYAYEAAKQAGLCDGSPERTEQFQKFWLLYLGMASEFEAAQQIYTLSLLDDERKQRAEDRAYYRHNNRNTAVFQTLSFLIGAALVIVTSLL